jgi:hypothetical protein
MWFWLITFAIVIAGASGGVINALLSDSGFIAPGWYEEAGNRIWKPGVLGNMLLGAAAAFISWGLYGPFSAFVLMPPDLTTKATLTLSALVGAFLVGIGGARVITSEVEKMFYLKQQCKQRIWVPTLTLFVNYSDGQSIDPNAILGMRTRGYRTGAVQDPASELPRRSLPRTRVNKPLCLHLSESTRFARKQG